MAKHGEFFPENPQNVDELIDALAQRAAAAQRMLNSMSREQREELMALSQQAFGSPALMQQLAQLDANLQALRPGEDWSGAERFDGEQGLGLGDGTGVLQDVADLDDLAEQLAQTYDGARMDDLDLDKLARQLGNDAAVDARTLQRLEQALRDSGYLKRTSDGQLKLSPKAMRQLGSALLRDVATRMSGRQGQRDVRHVGRCRRAVRRDAVVGVRRHRAVGRHPHGHQRGAASRQPTAATRAGRRHLHIDDVEVAETEARTQACVALLVDTSFSMAMDGRWVPMKRTALALHTLIRSRFRGDALQLIAFGRYAQTMDIEELTALDARWDKGTNLHHGLLLANRHFRKHPNAQPVLLIVTDGEPTSTSSRAARSTSSTRPTRSPSPTPYASSTTPAAWARRQRSSGSATIRAWRGSSTPWPAASTAGWSRPSSTTSALPSSAPTWARAARPVGRTGTTATGSAAAGSGSAAEPHSVVEEGALAPVTKPGDGLTSMTRFADRTSSVCSTSVRGYGAKPRGCLVRRAWVLGRPEPYSVVEEGALAPVTKPGDGTNL